MHIYNLDQWQHRHRYVIDDGHGERNTRRVILLTLTMMVIEIGAGYLHVLADALTSVLAIIALLTGKIFGWVWMDPAMGIVGALVITKWSHGLLIDTGKILLDRDVNQEAVEEIRAKMEAESDTRVTDIHIWRVGSHHLSAIISLVTHYPKSPDYYKQLLSDYEEIVHITIEVNKGEGEPCVEVT